MSFSESSSRNRVSPVFPLSSMIDILFLLLIFFLTASVFRDQDRQIEVSLPQAQSAKVSQGGTQIVITVTAGGQTYMGDKAYEPQALKQVLTELAREYPDESVIIRADQNSQTGSTVGVLDLVYASGLRNVFLATTKKQNQL